MKSFNQFLKEYYIKEETPVGRVRSPREQAVWDKINARELAAQQRAQQRKSARNGSPPRGTKTNVPRSGISGESGGGALALRTSRIPGTPDAKDFEPIDVKVIDPKPPALPSTNARRSSAVERSNQAAVGSGPSGKPPIITPPPKAGALALRTSRIPGTPDAMVRGAQDAANKPPATPKPPASTPSPTTNPSSSAGKPPALPSTNARRASAEAKKAAAAAGSGPSGKPATPMPGSSSGGKPPKTPEAPKVPGKFAKIGKFAGPASAALDTALSTADERSKGSGWARSLAKGATVAAGGLLGGTAGAIGGGGLLSAVTGTAGAMAGAAAAEKAFDTAAGANAVQRKAIATANRKGQAGGAIKGIGGKTTFDTKKNTITTGTGPQRKTAQLGKTSVVTNPKTGKQEVGNLAYKDGKAVYKRSDTKSLAQTSSNPLERIGRSLFAGAYKQSDAANTAKKLNQARQSDSARNKALGVKMLPGK